MFLQLLAETPVKETLFMYLLNQFSWQQTGDFFLRVILACVCGAGIGFERARRFKGAGMRTHIIVCCGAALIMIVSKYGFADLTNAIGAPFNGTRGADPARVAAQVVSGISFLGAGVIFKNHGMVKGLTTAAGLWVTAGIGLAMGAGLYTLGAFTTVLVAALQILMHKFQIGADAFNAYQLQFTVRDSEDFRASLKEKLDEWRANTSDTKIEHRDDGSVIYDMTVRTTKDLEIDDILSFFDNVKDVENLNVASIH